MALTLLLISVPIQAQSTNEIIEIVPVSADSGTTGFLVTFTLDTDTPPAPPAGVMPDSVTIGSLTGTSVTHTMQYTITALFDIPVSEPTGDKNVEITFTVPEGTLIFYQNSGFTVTGGQLPTATPTGPTATPSTPPENSYPIVDTGQTVCYNNSSSITFPDPGDAFYGQDAQFDGYQPSYTSSPDELTVQDNVTGLIWQHTIDSNDDGIIDVNDKMTWTEAQSYPDTLNAELYGGYDDWRLPSIKELYSLIDFTGMDPSGYEGSTESLVPFIDTGYFEFEYGDESADERIIDSQYASSNVYVSTEHEDSLFGVNFADGRIKGYGLTLFGIDKIFFVQCVRGNPDYGLNNFLNNGNGTVTDLATGLVWDQNDSGTPMNWEESLTWIEARNAESYLGYTDWRLPNAKELQSLLDYSRSPYTTGSAAIDPVFNATVITNEDGVADYPWYWTGTTHANWMGYGDSGAYLCFGRGLGWMELMGDTCFTGIDVHGAGAQRSDPKTGTLTTYYMGEACSGGSAYGFGPQGDFIRIDNFVRAVRTLDNDPTPTPVCLNHGDVNSDGTITAGDAQRCFLIALGSYIPDETELCAADCNGDTITAGDAQQIFETALKIQFMC